MNDDLEIFEIDATEAVAPQPRKRRTKAEIAADTEAAEAAARDQREAEKAGRIAEQTSAAEAQEAAIQEAIELLHGVPDARWHVAQRSKVKTSPYRPTRPEELRDVAPFVYGSLPFPGQVQRWARLWKSVKLTQAETTPRTNPDGSTTQVTRVAAPELTRVRFDAENGGWRIHVRPLPGQKLGDFQAAIPALQAAWRLPSITAGASRDQAVILNLGTHRPSFPAALYPNPREITRVTTEAGAVAAYETLEIDLGITPDGRRLTYKPKAAPHALVAGGTGSGKSVFLRGVVETFRAAGADIVIADGKSSGDYSALAAPGVAANVLHVGGDEASILRTVQYAYDEMQQRKSVIDALKIRGVGGNPFRPLLFLFDESADFTKRAKQRPQKDFARYTMMMDSLLSQGRSMRVHLILCAQTLYSESIPNSWQSNISTKIVLGKPDAMSLEKAVEDASLRPRAEALRSQIDTRTKGRGLYVFYDDRSGESDVTLLMTPFSYSPAAGLGDAPDARARKAWSIFKEHVSDAVPRFSARLGIAFDHDLGEVDSGYKSADDHADWHGYSLPELAQLPMVPLDDSAGPIETAKRYDRAAPEYAGGTTIINAAHGSARLN